MLSTGERQVSGCFSGGFEKGFVINRVTYPFPPFQHSDSDSDPEYSSLPPSIPSAVPVTGESFCDCEGQNEATFCNSLHTAHRGKDCRCGEEDEDFDWVWDDLNKSSATLLSCDNRKVSFHMEYSCGTAAIRGTKELGDGQHFWEIKMTSPVYGTDMVNGQARG